MMETFVSNGQLSLDLGSGFMPASIHEPMVKTGALDPRGLFDTETDPTWIEDVLARWDDLKALKHMLEQLYDDLRNNECLSGSKTSEFQRSLVHDLRESIRVVGTRVRELEARNESLEGVES